MALLQFLKKELSCIYDECECRAVSRVLIEDLFNLKVIDFLSGNEHEFTEKEHRLLDEAICRLKNGEPVQYVTGVGRFGEFKFKVNSTVLIPRPETKELVDVISLENRGMSLRLLDIGTGSGCIAISLSCYNPEWYVEAWDISPGAVKTAIENAELNNVNVNFKCVDIFYADMPDNSFDVVVSNPPYIKPSEKSFMERNVLDYEPHMALFVPEDNPLLFYHEIALKCLKWLTEGGKLYFEINSMYHSEVEDMLSGIGYNHVETIIDYKGNYRFVKAIK